MPTLSEYLAGYQRRLEHVVQAAPKELSYRIIGRWAVDTGSSANSWTPNVGDPIAKNVDTTGGSIAPVLGRVDAVTRSISPGDKYSLANGKPYARRLEYAGWSQRHMPNGAVRISVAEWQPIVDGSARDARRMT